MTGNGENSLTCYSANCLFLISFVFSLFIANCKIQSGQKDALDRSVQFISVDGVVTFAFRSELALQCSVVAGDTSYTCSKPEGSQTTWQARLGELEQGQKVVLHMQPEGGEAQQRTYTWRERKQSQRDFRLKLNIPLTTAEIVQVEDMAVPDSDTDASGCQVEASEDKVLKNAEIPFSVNELATSGFGEAAAQYHTRNTRYVRLNYATFAREQEWGFRYMLEDAETLFTLHPPALLQGVTASSEQDVELVDTLRRQRRKGKVSNRTPVEVTWQLGNPSPKMRLSILITSDDKDTQAKCFADPKDERMKLDREFLQQLPAGSYTMLVQLHATQRVTIAGSMSASWLVDTYDWRQGMFEKL